MQLYMGKWNSGGSKGGGTPAPKRPIFSRFHAVYVEKFNTFVSWRPYLRVGAPHWENPGSASVEGSFRLSILRLKTVKMQRMCLIIDSLFLWAH